MPSSGGYIYGSPSDYHRRARILQDVAAQMISEGWTPHARKFLTVRNRRAVKLWRMRDDPRS